MSKQQFPTIPPDALIDIKVSGSFYRKLLGLSIMLAESKPLEEYKAVLEKIKRNDPETSVYEVNVHTILTIINEVETAARAQNKIKMVEMDVEEPSGN
jgi:hypothetical protein